MRRGDGEERGARSAPPIHSFFCFYSSKAASRGEKIPHVALFLALSSTDRVKSVVQDSLVSRPPETTKCRTRARSASSTSSRAAPRSGRAFRTEGGGNAAPGPARDPAMARLSRAALVALVVLTSLVAEVRGARTRALSSPSKKRRSPPRLLPPRSVADSPAPVHPARSSPGRAPRVERDAPRAAPRRLGPDVARARGRRLAPEPSTPSSSRGGDALGRALAPARLDPPRAARGGRERRARRRARRRAPLPHPPAT